MNAGRPCLERGRFSVIVCVLATVVMVGTSVFAAGSRDTIRNPPDQDTTSRLSLAPGWYLKTDLAFSWHSWGLVSASEFFWRRPGEVRHGMIWSQLELGGRFTISPAATRFGLLAEWMPAAFLQLRAHYDAYVYHGAFGYLLTYDSPGEPHSEEDVYDRQGEEEPGFGQRVWLMTVLRAAVGAIVLRNQTDLVGYFVHTDGPWFYNWEYETLTRPSDFVFGNRTQLLVNALHGHKKASLYIGPFYSVSLIPSSDVRIQKTGIDLYTEPFGTTRRMGVPRVLLIVGMNIEEAYRTREMFLMVGIGSTWRLTD